MIFFNLFVVNVIIKKIQRKYKMPYIKKELRPECDNVVSLMNDIGIKANGDLNYILFKFCKYYVTPGYGNYKNFTGELQKCITEIDRKILAPYEDTKMEENGDV